MMWELFLVATFPGMSRRAKYTLIVHFPVLSGFMGGGLIGGRMRRRNVYTHKHTHLAKDVHFPLLHMLNGL